MSALPEDVPDDAELVRRARAGDLAAFGLLYERHRGTAVGLCRRILADRDLAGEVVQEAAVQALLGLERLRRDESFGAWLCGIALNLARRRLRHRGREVWVLAAATGGGWLEDLPAPDPGPAEEVATRELAEAVREAVSRLPEGQRQAVALFYFEGLPYPELAAELGITLGATKARLHKARAVLRRRLWWMREEAMTTPTKTEDVELEVVDVRRFPETHEGIAKHVVVLQERGGDRQLPIWLGPTEAQAIALALEEVETPRPLTYQFMARVLGEVGAEVRRVRITELVDRVYYAVVEVGSSAGGRKEVDCRPSDAINLALISGAPIATTEEVIRAGGGDRHPEYEGYEAGSVEIAAEIQRWMRAPEA